MARRQILAILAALLVLFSLTIPVAQSAPAYPAPAVAYVRGGNLWIKALPDGQARRLTQDGQAHTPAWSPDGQWVAFRDSGQMMVAARSKGLATALDGSALTQVADHLTLGDPKESAHWFGYYGHLNWDATFAWWPGGPTPLPSAGAGGASLPGLLPVNALLAVLLGAGMAGVCRRSSRSRFR